jgi:predicted amidohydrolase YtcJ
MRSKVSFDWTMCAAAAVLSLAIAAPRLSGQQRADLILHNGRILTVDASFSTAQAVAVTGNKFTAVGSDADVMKLAGPNTKTIDLKGRTVVPGLIDTHLHITGPGAYMDILPPDKARNYSVDWKGVSNKDDVLNQIRGIMTKFHPPKGEWIAFANQLSFSGVGGDINPRKNQAKILYDDMNRYDLDKVIPDNPAILTMGVPDENALFVNSPAIDILWAKHGDFIKKYGRYWIDQGGKPEGHLEPPATRLLLNLYAPKLDPADMAPGIKKRLDELAAQGHTTISTKMRVNGIDAYKLLEKQGTQPVRLGYGLGWDFFGSVEAMDQLKQFANQVGTGSDMNWVSSVAPSSVDGASTRACTNQKRDREFGPIDQWFPVGQCHTDSEYRGGSNRPANIAGNYFQDWIMAMPKYNLRLANDHVAGDRSVANLLSMIEKLQAQYGKDATKNWGFDHCTMVDPKDFARAARLGVMFSCAPKYIQDVAPTAAVSYGPQVANTFVVPVNSLIKAGAKVVYEADQDTYVWHDLEVFITRKDENGKVWGPQEKLDRKTTLQTVTRWAADYVLKPDKIGSIEVGKLADLAVLDRDYMTIPDEDVHNVRSLLTLMDGRATFVDTTFSAENSYKPAGAIVSTFQDVREARPKGRTEGMVGEGGG